jgi:Transposase domain (DUF772)
VLRTVSDAPTLWESVIPECLMGVPGDLAEIDALLDDPRFFEPFRAFFDPTHGRPSIPMETYLRMMFLKYRYRLGFEPLYAEVADSLAWRRFCRVPLGCRMPHPTTLMKITSRCGPRAIDPLTLDALTVCLTARAAMGTANPHPIVTRGTRLHAGPASAYFMNHVLGPAGTKPALLRQTRVADLAHRTDPRLVATALGMTAEGAMHYLTDAVDHDDIAFNTDRTA